MGRQQKNDPMFIKILLFLCFFLLLLGEDLRMMARKKKVFEDLLMGSLDLFVDVSSQITKCIILSQINFGCFIEQY
jgi:hypothetical protein